MAGDQRASGRRLLVLGAGAGQLDLIEAARRRGLYVIAADRDPAAPGFRFADRRAILSAEDEEAIHRLASAERVDGIVAPGIDWPVGIAARVAEKLDIPHPLDPVAAVLATSKLRQRERFAQAGVPHPRYAVCATVEEAREAADGVGYPCVVKPPDRQGQKGVAVVEEPDDLAAAVEGALAAARGPVVLVEELVAGGELTVNAFSAGGRLHPVLVTDRVLAPQPAFGVALAHVWPSEQAPEVVGAAVEAAAAAAAALGIEEGPTYTQVLLREDGPVVGELAARLGGGHDAVLCEAAVGVALNDLAVAAALGEPVDRAALSPSARAGGACVRFLVPPPGALVAVHGVEEAERAPSIVRVRVYRDPGFIFTPLRRGADRAGAVVAVGADREAAVARAARAADSIRLETADAEALVN